MASDFNIPIKCPNCNKPLISVRVQVTKVLEWTIGDNDEDDSGKFEDNGQGATEVFCHNCNKEIGYYDANNEWGLFPDSTVVNF